MKAITFPFRIDAHGKVAMTTDPHKVWLDRVRAVLNTQVGDRVMRPTFGFDSESMLLNLGSPADGDIRGAVQRAFSSFLPSLRLTGVEVNMPQNSQTVSIRVLFTYPDNTSTSTSVTFSDGSVVSEYDNSEVYPL